ncbi:MAG: glycosyltransferase [Marinobacter sp.]
MDPHVSIVIPVYQDQPGLNRCLEALSSQVEIDLADVEVIVVDNGHTPEIGISQDFPFSVQLLWCDKKGAYAARNVGRRAAKGDVLVFIDADCWPDRHWLRAGLAALMPMGEPIVVGGNVLFQRNPVPSAVELYQILMGFGQERSIKDLHFSATANLFVARDLFEKVGDFNEELLSGGDREWSWRAINSGAEIRYAPDAIIWTSPRRTLRSAIIQARRVAGGRRVLGDDQDIVRNVGLERIQPSGTISGKLKSIFLGNDMSVWQRCRVFCVAIVIRLVHDLEVIRLRMGGKPERR